MNGVVTSEVTATERDDIALAEFRDEARECWLREKTYLLQLHNFQELGFNDAWVAKAISNGETGQLRALLFALFFFSLKTWKVRLTTAKLFSPSQRRRLLKAMRPVHQPLFLTWDRQAKVKFLRSWKKQLPQVLEPILTTYVTYNGEAAGEAAGEV